MLTPTSGPFSHEMNERTGREPRRDEGEEKNDFAKARETLKIVWSLDDWNVIACVNVLMPRSGGGSQVRSLRTRVTNEEEAWARTARRHKPVSFSQKNLAVVSTYICDDVSISGRC